VFNPEDIQNLSEVDFYKGLQQFSKIKEKRELTKQELEKHSLFRKELIIRERRDFYKAYNDPEALKRKGKRDKDLEEIDAKMDQTPNRFECLDKVRVKSSSLGVPASAEGFVIDLLGPDFER